MRRSTLTLLGIAVSVVVIAALLRTGASESEGQPTFQPSTEPTQTSQPPTTTTPSASTTTATQLPATALPPGTTVCDLYTGVDETGRVEATALVEASGIASSIVAPGVLWAHNDSGGSPALFAFTSTGEDLGTFDIPGAAAFDWEDMARGPDQDGTGSYLYIGDIGDNFRIRGGRVSIYVVPDTDPRDLDGAFPQSLRLDFQYPKNAFNAEALFIDPLEPALYLVTKDRDQTFVLKGDLTPNAGVTELELVGVLSLGEEVTAADMSADGTTLVLRGYHDVWMWHRDGSVDIETMLLEPPCSAPSPDEVQGESIALDSTFTYWTISEGSNSAIQRVTRLSVGG